MRILISGDSHADVNHLKSLESKVEKFDCDRVFIVGDFGYWPNLKGGDKFLEACKKFPYPIYFLHGNHDDIDILNRHIEEPDLTEDGFIQVHPNIYYAPTGHVWEWDGVRFGAVGGAFSIDRANNVKFVTWFPDEMISDEDVAKFDGQEVDVLLAHDSVWEVVQAAFAHHGRVLTPIGQTRENMEQVRKIVDKTKPNIFIHGHWHFAYSMDYRLDHGVVNFIGLNCNKTQTYYTVLDTEAVLGQEFDPWADLG